MIDRKTINNIFQIKESFELPEKCMSVMLDCNEREKVFQQILEVDKDLSRDAFTDYFQEQHSNREQMMQDFTPKELSFLVSQIKNDFTDVADICAGTGGLTIAAWERNPNAEFRCEELSKRAFPLLLLNMSIRNMSGYAINKDILTGEVFSSYRIERGDRFSKIIPLDSEPKYKQYNLVITNPPYSLKWQPNENRFDERFIEYGYAPPQYADYAFVLHCVSLLCESGECLAILPHGVLFRGGKEGTIRKKLIEKGNIKSVIGLPEKLFLNTGIPVCIMQLVKTRSEDILFIDASKEYDKRSKNNVLKNIDKILSICQNRLEVAKCSHLASFKEISSNDFNLNISRYIDTFTPEPLPDLVNILQDLENIENEISKTNSEILSQINQLKASNSKDADELGKSVDILRRIFDDKNKTIRLEPEKQDKSKEDWLWNLFAES